MLSDSESSTSLVVQEVVGSERGASCHNTKLVSKIQAVDARIGHTKRELCDLFTERNALLPIHSLPDEIFTMILEIAIYDVRPGRATFLLLVCRRWRTFATATATFWGTIDSKWWLQTLDLLPRSRNARLSVRWNERDPVFPRGIYAESAMSDTQLEIYRDLLRAALQQFHRIDYLCLVRIDPATYQSLKQYIPAVSNIVRYINIGRDDSPPADIFPMTRAPLLHTLELENIHPPDVSQCDFPLLEQFCIYTMVWNPNLNDLLDFFARTSELRNLDLTILDSVPDLVLQNTERTALLRSLKTYSCTIDNLTSPMASLLSRIISPQLETVYYSLAGFYEVAVPLEDIFARLLPFSIDALQPLRLQLDEDAYTIRILCFTLTAKSHPLKSVQFSLDALNDEDSDEENERRSNFLLTLCQKTLSTAFLGDLECQMLIEPPFWLQLLASSANLTSVQLRLDALSRFSAALLLATAQEAKNAHFLPALSELQIDCVDGRMYTPLTWTGKLKQLADALRARAACGQKQLDEIRIVRDAVYDLPGYRRGEYRPKEVTKGWPAECAYLPMLCELVGTLKVRPRWDDPVDSDSDA